jgi:hypothetical protein
MREPQTGEAYAAVMCELYRILGSSHIVEPKRKKGPIPDSGAETPTQELEAMLLVGDARHHS